MTDSLRITLVGGPTALIEYGGLRLLTDPTFDPPGPHPVGQRSLDKLTGPAIEASDLTPVDAVLLSHDQHPDNLDDAGRALLAEVPLVITTSAAAARINGNTSALEPWQHVELERPGGAATVTIYGTPAVHGPEGYDASSGPVIGFVLTGEDLPTVYVSGDNASLRVVDEVADSFGPIDGAVLFCGRARTARLDANLTLSGRRAAQAAELLEADWIVPVHTEGWGHFSEGVAEVVEAFEAVGLDELLRVIDPGETIELETDW
ncbi:MBL fold metallo-hydrolase [Gryllotalpicola reticulitermitis]|uniref:MBL fold metallo-hydrolase n=1 Tax=Gryllotalpicola reticulitermitis TaxID=1184153 RepID=A0ABV8Q393_9MICO